MMIRSTCRAGTGKRRKMRPRICALGFIGVGVAFVLGTLEMLFDARPTFTSQDWWWIAVLIVSVVSGMAWAAHVTHREFRLRRRTQC